MSRTKTITDIQADLQAFSTYVYLFQQRVAEAMKLHPTDFHSIHLLSKHGSLTAGQLAARLQLTSGATTAVIDRLVGLGLAERVSSDIDRRSTVVRLRPDGIQKMQREYASVNQQLGDSLGEFSEAELGVIHRFLQAMTGIS